MTNYPPADIGDGRRMMNGEIWWNTADGGALPDDVVKPLDKLKDEVVRKIVSHGLALSDQVSRFLGHTFDDIGQLESLIAQEYQARLGGKKGNISLYTVDGLFKVEVRVQDRIDFGPELQIAKKLVDECLNEWAADARVELRAIVTRAFNTDQAGKINRSEIFTLLRMDITDPRGCEAMRAIRDAMIVIGSKTYVRMWRRPRHDAAWQSITIDLARA